MKVPTASVYCSRKRASAMASRKARGPRFSVYHAGRGRDPVIVVGSVIVSVVLVMTSGSINVRLKPDATGGQKFYPEESDGESRLRGSWCDGQPDGGPPDGQRP